MNPGLWFLLGIISGIVGTILRRNKQNAWFTLITSTVAFTLVYIPLGLEVLPQELGDFWEKVLAPVLGMLTTAFIFWMYSTYHESLKQR